MSRQVAEARRFHVSDAERGRERPEVVYGGWELARPDYVIRRTGFPFYALEFVAGGRGVLRMNGREYDLQRGVVFTYGPKIAHEIVSDPRDRLSKYFVDFSGRSALAFLARAGLSPGRCQPVAAVDEVESTFERLLAAGQRGTRASSDLVALYGRVLLVLMGEIRIPEGVRIERSRLTYLRCRDFLEKNFLSLGSAEEAAKACGVTPAHFSRLFRRFSGQPAYRFLLRLRMNQALAFLEHHGLNVNETADRFGMDPFHFSRVFKRLQGRPPSAFLRGESPGGDEASQASAGVRERRKKQRRRPQA